jgi:hypothetical protein
MFDCENNCNYQVHDIDINIPVASIVNPENTVIYPQNVVVIDILESDAIIYDNSENRVSAFRRYTLRFKLCIIFCFVFVVLAVIGLSIMSSV